MAQKQIKRSLVYSAIGYAGWNAICSYGFYLSVLGINEENFFLAKLIF